MFINLSAEFINDHKIPYIFVAAYTLSMPVRFLTCVDNILFPPWKSVVCHGHEMSNATTF